MTSRETLVAEQVPKNEDGKKLLFTGKESFGRYMKSLKLWFESNKLGRVLRNELSDIPIRPTGAINRMNNSTDNHGDRKKVKKWNEESGVWESKCAEVLALFKKTMAPSIKLYLKGAFVNYKLATRANIMDIIEQANLKYGGHSQEKAELNYIMMRAIPSFLSVSLTSSGMQKMTELLEDRIEYNKPSEIWTDEQMKGFLRSKIIEWPELNLIKGLLDLRPDATYQEAKDMLNGAIKRISNQELIMSVQAHEMAIKVNPLFAKQSMTDTNTPIPATSIDEWYAAAASSRQAGRGSGCYNCGMMTHWAIDCTSMVKQISVWLPS
jgi:hypothetical protein